MEEHSELTDEQRISVRKRTVSEATIVDTWVDDVGGIHLELIFESPRILRLRSGDYSFGHGGMTKGIHMCDDFCASPSSLELMEAGINPRNFVEQSRR